MSLPPESKRPRWSVESSVVVQRDEWITLRSDVCRTQAGHQISPFYVLEYPDWVTACVIDAELRVVVIEQYRHGAQTWTSEFVCGSTNNADELPLEAVVREVREETGLGKGRWWSLGSAWVNASSHSNRNHYFLGIELLEKYQPSADPAEVLHVRRVPIDEFFEITHLELPSLHLALLPLLRAWLRSDAARTAGMSAPAIERLSVALQTGAH